MEVLLSANFFEKNYAFSHNVAEILVYAHGRERNVD